MYVQQRTWISFSEKKKCGEKKEIAVTSSQGKCYGRFYLFILFYFISSAYYMIQKNKGISIINAKLGRDTTTAVKQLQWS